MERTSTMKNTIKAIETQYKGFRFRSRLEARWAVFFEAMCIEWQYEPEGYELQSGRYLPDFKLPKCGYRGMGAKAGSIELFGSVGLFVEIKGQEPTQHEKRLCIDLGQQTNTPIIICVGLPPNQYGCFGDRDGGRIYDMFPGGDVDMTFMRCCKCRRVKVDYALGRSNYHCDYCQFYFDEWSLAIMEAGNAARAARFEHGEEPDLSDVVAYQKD